MNAMAYKLQRWTFSLRARFLSRKKVCARHINFLFDGEFDGSGGGGT